MMVCNIWRQNGEKIRLSWNSGNNSLIVHITTADPEDRTRIAAEASHYDDVEYLFNHYVIGSPIVFQEGVFFNTHVLLMKSYVL